MPSNEPVDLTTLDHSTRSRLWNQLIAQVKAALERDGWELQACLWTVRPAHIQPDVGSPFLSMTQLGAAADPMDLLWETRVAPDDAAVLLTWESLDMVPMTSSGGPPDVVLAQSRHIALVDRSGHMWGTRTIRDQGNQPGPGREGLIEAALHRTIEQPAPRCPLTVGHWLGRLALGAALDRVLAVPSLTPAQGRHLLEQALAAAARHLAGTITGQDPALFGHHLLLGTYVGDLTAAAAERTWEELLCDTRLTSPLPARIQGSRTWADPQLTAWAASDDTISQADQMRVLEEIAPDLSWRAMRLLAELGWLEV